MNTAIPDQITAAPRPSRLRTETLEDPTDHGLYSDLLSNPIDLDNRYDPPPVAKTPAPVAQGNRGLLVAVVAHRNRGWSR